MFSPDSQALDLTSDLSWGRLLRTPFNPGVWALLPPMGRQNHAPQLCWIRRDLLACVWMAGGGEGTAGMSIFMSLLEQGAEDWSFPQRISRDNQRSEQNPLLFVSGDQLHLIHSAQLVRGEAERSWSEQGAPFSMQWTAALRHQTLMIARIRVSDPETWAAESWGSARDLLEEPAFCRHPPHRRNDGNWILPIYRSLQSGGAFGHDHSEVLLLSADGEVIAEPISIPASKGRVHGSIVLAGNGRDLLQFFRSRLADRIYRSISVDSGQAWSEPEAIALPNNNSSIQALRLLSGRLAMIYNRFCFEPDPEQPQAWGEANWPRTRWPLSVALSDDDGASWPWIRDLDTGWGFHGPANWTLNGQLAYPTLLEGAAGDLHLAYSWAGREAIRYVCLKEHEILGKSPSAEEEM